MSKVKLSQKAKANLIRLRDDFQFYAAKALKIRTKEGKLLAFKLNPAQTKLDNKTNELKAQGKPIKIIILKARQMGFSTYTEGRIFRKTSMTKLTNSLIIAHKEDASSNLFNMSKLFYEEMPDYLRPMKKASNAKELIFENPTPNVNDKQKNPGLRSKIKIDTAKNLGAGRSETIQNLHASEVAFWDNAEQVMLGLLQAVPDDPETMVIIESTPNGIGGYFYDLWNNAVKGLNDFTPLFFAWFEHPEYKRPLPFSFELDEEEQEIKQVYRLTDEQMVWRRWCIENNCNGDKEMFKQEYPSSPEEAFLSSGTPVFDNQKVLLRKKYLEQFYKDSPPLRGNIVYDYDDEKQLILDDSIRFEPDKNGWLTVYEEPLIGYPYVIGGDIAEGGIDLSVGQVRNNTTWKKAATWRAHTDTDLYAKQMYCLGKWFNTALIGIETNFDLHPVKELQRLGYWHQYNREIMDKFTGELQKKYGFQTTGATRPVIISKYVTLARESIELENDVQTLGEMLVFVRDENGRPAAQEGEHDDCVMADAICNEIRTQQSMTVTEEPIERPKKLAEKLGITKPERSIKTW